MGINRLNILLAKYAPEAFFTISMSRFSGKRIAIDAHFWMYTYMSIARKNIIRNSSDLILDEEAIRKEWLSFAVNFVLNLLCYKITPIFVFDGVAPVEKQATKEKREKERQNIKMKIDILYEKIKTDPSQINLLRDQLCNYTVLTQENRKIFKQTLIDLGVPCIQASSEGEQLCSMLCIDKIVAAVYSNDTDNLCYGCPLMITNINNGNFTCTRLDRVLTGLKMSFETFVDLCIMCGCDHNTNMPGIACIKSYKLLLECIKIENIHMDTTCLKYNICRKLFRYRPHTDLCESLEVDINTEIKENPYLIPHLTNIYKVYKVHEKSNPGGVNLRLVIV